MAAAPAELASLVAGVRAGDTRAVARAISLVEDQAGAAQPLLQALFPHAGRSLVVGVTGPPGAGKSSLVDKLTALLRGDGQSVGIVAVDPSSPFSGGAILGDRIRMQAHATDPGVFIRSMATRGHLGGLAAATDHVVTILSAAGKDVILVETVGVGQDEVEIVGTADVNVVVLVPGLGDEVQALKAGIMEIADVFVVNKADRDGADRVVAEIESMLSLVPTSAMPPAIVRSVAIRDEGTRAIVDAVVAFHARARETGALERKRRMTLERQLEDAVTRRLVQRAMAALGPGEKEALVERLVRRELDPWSAAEELFGKDGPRVKILKIDHLGIAVKSLAAAARAYEALGFQVAETHEVPTEKVRAAFLSVGESQLELLEPTEPGSVIARFLERRSGLHHVCLLVDDIDAALAELRARGVPLVDETPRPGAGGCRVAFVHPKGAEGVLLELKEEAKR